MHPTETAAETNIVNGEPRKYHCGTLTYTKAGLFILFAWLLWGDFCYTLMEAVAPTILPLKLKALGCPNWLMGAILGTVPGILNMTVCPYVSFKSDRYRSRWGRRIPFIVWTMPFLCCSLALLGWSDDICVLLQKHSDFLNQFAPSTITIALIAVFIAMFQFFNMFVGSVFWYLFNDVVPAQFLARFSGTFKIVSSGAGALYNFFIFRYAESHMREIFIGAAVLYFVGFGLMCLKVKEGEYPVVEKKQDKCKKSWDGLKLFFEECFTDKFYWMLFGFNAMLTLTGATKMFDVFFYREMGLSLAQIGKYTATVTVAALVAMYFTAIFVDRWHPLRVFAYLSVFAVIGYLMNWVWVFVKIPADYFFWLCMGGCMFSAFQTAIASACMMPLSMRMLPQSRYGQFCSAKAMVRSFMAMGSGVAAGLFMDLMRWCCGGSDFSYRFIFVWTTVCSAITAVTVLCTYIYWYRLGGDAHYHPPAPWSASKVEEMPIVPYAGPQLRWLSMALRIFNFIMLLPLFIMPGLMFWMYRQQIHTAFFWYGVLILPLALTAWFCWLAVEKGIRRDIALALNGELPRNGIPHHGVLVIVGIKFLLTLSLWVAQVIITINLEQQSGTVVFGIANVITDFLLIGSVWLLARIERGHSTVIFDSSAPASSAHK